MKRLALLFLLCCARNEPAVTIASAPTSSTPAPTTSTPAASPPVTTCIEIDQDNLTGKETSIDGVVTCGEHSHPNGSTFTFCVLRLDQPRCVKGSSTTGSVEDVQLAGETDFKKLKGQHVRLQGDAFPEHTAWHVRPVLLMVK